MANDTLVAINIFAEDGDITTVPSSTQSDGSMSIYEGITALYAEELPADGGSGLTLNYEQDNYLYNIWTTYMNSTQKWGISEYVDTVTYSAGAFTYKEDGQYYYDGTNWNLITLTDIATNTTDIATNVDNIADNLTALKGLNVYSTISTNLDDFNTPKSCGTWTYSASNATTANNFPSDCADLAGSITISSQQGLTYDATSTSEIAVIQTLYTPNYGIYSRGGYYNTSTSSYTFTSWVAINPNAETWTSYYATLSSTVTTNTTDIATNTTDIATNTTDIATNTTNVTEATYQNEYNTTMLRGLFNYTKNQTALDSMNTMDLCGIWQFNSTDATTANNFPFDIGINGVIEVFSQAGSTDVANDAGYSTTEIDVIQRITDGNNGVYIRSGYYNASGVYEWTSWVIVNAQYTNWYDKSSDYFLNTTYTNDTGADITVTARSTEGWLACSINGFIVYAPETAENNTTQGTWIVPRGQTFEFLTSNGSSTANFSDVYCVLPTPNFS